MARSQRVAAAVALRKLGYHVVVKPTGVVVAQLIPGTHAPCNLQPSDVVVAVDGTADADRGARCMPCWDTYSREPWSSCASTAADAP